MKNEEKYKLYRSLYDIMNPTISRKNISNYKIIIDSNILPIEVYYPNKNIKLKSIILYIPSGNNHNLYQNLARNTNNLVIVLDDGEDKEEFYHSIKYIYDHIGKIMVDTNNITIMSDNEGSKAYNYIINKAIKTQDFKINKSILLEPTSRLNKNTIKNSLVVINQDSDSSIKNNKMYNKMYLNDFYNGKNTTVNKRVYKLISEYIIGG